MSKSVMIEDGLHKKLKLFSVQKERQIIEIVEKAINYYIDKEDNDSENISENNNDIA